MTSSESSPQSRAGVRAALVLIVAGPVLILAGLVILLAGRAPGDVGMLPVPPASGPSAPAGLMEPAPPEEAAGSDAFPSTPRSRLSLTAPRPAALRIPAIGVDAPVVAVGVEEDGSMEVPYDVDTVGWYRPGPSPGGAGSAVLAAHVDLAGRGPGVFFYLSELAPGDVLTVGFDDGTEANFEVMARRTYDRESLPVDFVFATDGPPFLTLVTCGGAFDPSTRRYQSNVVVYAVPAPAPEPVGDRRA